MLPFRPIDRQLAAELTTNWAITPRVSCRQYRNPNGTAFAVTVWRTGGHRRPISGASFSRLLPLSSPARLPAHRRRP